MPHGHGLGAQPRVRLVELPTPLQEAPRLREALGGAGRCPRILIKRDDLTGLAFGGNKGSDTNSVPAAVLIWQSSLETEPSGSALVGRPRRRVPRAWQHCSRTSLACGSPTPSSRPKH